MLIVIVFLLLRGSVSVLPYTLALSIGPNVYDSKFKHDYRIPYGKSGKGCYISCPSIVQGAVISDRNTITKGNCKGLIGQV